MNISDLLKDPVAIATLSLAFVTAILAAAAFLSIYQNSKWQKRERTDRLLNEIIEWAIKVRKYIFSFDSGGFNSELERSEAKEKYSTLRFTGMKLIKSVERETLGNTMLGHLKKTNNLFDAISWNSLKDSDKKEYRKTYDKECEKVIEEAINLKAKI